MRHALEDVTRSGLRQRLVLRRQLRHDLLKVVAHGEVAQRQPADTDAVRLGSEG